MKRSKSFRRGPRSDDYKQSNLLHILVNKRARKAFGMNKDTEVELLLLKVTKIFDGDVAKVKLWLSTPNPNLGNIAPSEMIKRGRIEKLQGFIDAAILEKRADEFKDRGTEQDWIDDMKMDALKRFDIGDPGDEMPG